MHAAKVKTSHADGYGEASDTPCTAQACAFPAPRNEARRNKVYITGFQSARCPCLVGSFVSTELHGHTPKVVNLSAREQACAGAWSMRAIRRRSALLVHHVDRCLVAVERCDERMLLGKELEGDVVRCQGIAELLHARRYIALLLLRSYLGSNLHRGQSYALAPCSSTLMCTAHTRNNSIHVLVRLEIVKGVM